MKQFNESLSDLLESMMHNTQTTGNFAAFIRVFLRRSSELKASEICQKLVNFENLKPTNIRNNLSVKTKIFQYHIFVANGKCIDYLILYL